MSARRAGRVPLGTLVLLAGAGAFLGWARLAGPLKPEEPKAGPPVPPPTVELVRWETRPERALERAGSEGRPVLLYLEAWGAELSLGMRRECFTNPALAGLLAARFVPLRIEAEDRPDLAEAYRVAAGVMGAQARLPLALCLLSDGSPFYATGYLPPGRLTRNLERIAAGWKEKRPELEGLAANTAAQTRQLMDPQLPPINPSGAILRNAVIDLLASANLEHGGFGPEAKELAGARLEFLARSYRQRPRPEVRLFLKTTLDAMAAGAVYDQVGGGFHHGTTDAAWLAPRFEKRLEDNAQLAAVYLLASQALREPEYRRVAEETLGFLLRDLRAKDGTFVAGLSAESAGKDGASYRWTPDQLRDALAPADRAALVSAFQLTRGPESPGLLYRQRSAADQSLAGRNGLRESPGLRTGAGTTSSRLDSVHAALLAARRQRPQPSVDRRFLADANGSAVRALALAYEISGNARYRQAAAEAARASLRRLVRSGKLPRAVRRPVSTALTGQVTPRDPARLVLLDDYAALAQGLMELRLATGDPQWGRAARSLIDRMNETLWNEGRARYYRSDRSPWPNAWPTGERDEAGPAPLARAAMALLAYARVAPADRAAAEHARAARLLRACAARASASPETNAGILTAIELLRSQPAPRVPAAPAPRAAPTPTLIAPPPDEGLAADPPADPEPPTDTIAPAPAATPRSRRRAPAPVPRTTSPNGPTPGQGTRSRPEARQRGTMGDAAPPPVQSPAPRQKAE